MTVPGSRTSVAVRAYIADHGTLRFIAIAVVYLASLRLGFLFVDTRNHLAAIWVASGFAIAVLVVRPRSEWLALLAIMGGVGFVNNLSATANVALSAGYSVANVAEYFTVALVLTTVTGQRVDFSRISDTLQLLVVTVAGISVPAAIGAGTLMVVKGADFWLAYRSWWASDALGIIVVVPLVVSWVHRKPRRRLTVGMALEMASFGLGWCIVTLLAFHSGFADLRGSLNPYMLVPMVVWAALRFEVRGVTASVIVIAAIAVGSTVTGATAFPLGGENPSVQLVRVQMYIAIAQVTGLLLAGARATMTVAEQAARQSAERLGRALAAAHMGTWEWDLISGSVQWSDEVASMFGLGTAARGFDWYYEAVDPEDRAALMNAIQSVLAGDGDCKNEHRFTTPDGSVRWLEVRGRAYYDRTGKPNRIVGTVMDATSRRATRESLRRAGRALKTLSSCNQILVRARGEDELLQGLCRMIVNESGYLMAWVAYSVDDAEQSVRVAAQCGFAYGELEEAGVERARVTDPPGLLGTALREGTVQVCQDIATDPRTYRVRAAALQRGCRSTVALPLMHDGKTFGALNVCAAEAGAFDEAEVGLLAELAHDLAFGLQALRTRVDHDRARQELAAREELLRQLIRHTPAAVAMFDTEMRYLQASEKWIKEYQLAGVDLIGRSHYEVFPDLPPHWRDVHVRVLAGGPVESCTDDPFPQADGSMWWLEWEVRPWHNSDGQIGGVTMFTNVITERKNAEIALRRQRRRADAIIGAAMDGIVTLDPQGRIQVFNPAAERMFKCPANAAVGKHIDRFIPEPAGGSGGNLVTKYSRVRTRNEVSGAFGDVIGRRTDGQDFPIEAFISQADLDGESLMTITLRDVTDRLAAERALRESEERFRQVVENIQEVFWVSDANQSQLHYVSPAYEKICGRTCASLYNSPQAWMDAVHPDDHARVARAASIRLTRGDYHEEYRIVRPDGTIRWIQERAVPIRGVDGSVYRLVGVAEDVTERRRIEDQFRQSQKMEAIGQLAGGVAHDFNNILGAIMMAAGEVAEFEGLPEDARDLINDVLHSSERAANLTRQLLLFSRRQVMQLRELNLNDVVNNVTRMLRRVVGEHIELVVRLHPDTLAVQADAGMLEQILVNMAVNARDAMQSGGVLTIETEAVDVDEATASRWDDAAPGRHVCLRVRDSGTGMSPELAARIFEPFFTTKEPGRGTGLGLATVFGIVKQHRGWITVDSEMGQGTTFHVYLKATVAPTPTVGLLSAPAAPKGGTETVLLVEDDPDIRKFTRMVLQRAGYNVVDAGSGVEAELLWGDYGNRIHLLLTDMVLPEGINGRELARRLRAKDAELRVIVTSGYSDEFAGRSVGADDGDEFLQKPWKPQQMLEAVRRCLDT